MTNGLRKMFSVPVVMILPDTTLPFSVFLYFNRNNHFVRYRFAHDFIDTARYQDLRNRGITEFWILESDREAYRAYLQPDKMETRQTDEEGDSTSSVANLSIPEQINEKTSAMDENYQEKVAEAEEVYTETEIIRATIEEKSLNSEEKQELLSAVSKELLDTFSKINSTSDEEKLKGLKKCRQIADEILVLASQKCNIYDEIIFIRQSQQDLEHSIVVSTLTAMFALALGEADVEKISDMVIAALFHDLGVSRVDPKAFMKLPQERTNNERSDYEAHVETSIELLKATSGKFPSIVYRMIAEHHENHDGSGFPRGLAGREIAAESEVLHLANWFDRLNCGKVTGERMPPKECFRYIYDTAVNSETVKEVTPKTISVLFDFMLNQKQKDAANAKASAIQETIQDKVLKKTG